jgi:hypothetical protein
MKNTQLNLTVLVFLFCIGIMKSKAQVKPLKRSEGYIGLHLDFHAFPKDTIGSNFTESLIDSMLSITRPDYIQVDCKGHPGISSYPTQVGNRAAYYKKDILKIWRDVTNKYKIPLVVHYSGVADDAANRAHPEWARIDTSGKADKRPTSTVGDYADKLMIPQLKELVDKYKIDAVWVDGDCWATRVDYSPKMLEGFQKETGIATIPKKNTDKGFFEFVEFNRRKFKEYVSKYVSALHTYNPDFQVTSNWIYSSQMPEKPDINVDFLSGDIDAMNCVNSAAFEARCLALQKKSWDLMAWSKSWNWRNTKVSADKSLVQLKQEAAQVLAMGGGFQSYWNQNSDGSPMKQNFIKMAEINAFCRERQPFCQQSEIIPQIAILHSTSAWKKKIGTMLYGGGGMDEIKNILFLALNGQHATTVLMEHQLDEHLSKYPVLIVPEWEAIEANVLGKLKNYVKNGGKIIIIGGKAVGDFRDELGVKFINPAKSISNNLFLINRDGDAASVEGWFQPFTPQNGTIALGKISQTRDISAPSLPVASIANFGKGKIAALYIDLSQSLKNNNSSVFQNVFDDLVNQIFTDPMVKVISKGLVHVVPTRKNGKTYIHLINTEGGNANDKIYNYNSIPLVTDLKISVLMDKKPEKIFLQPNNTPLPFTYQNGKIEVLVDKLDIHKIIEIY